MSFELPLTPWHGKIREVTMGIAPTSTVTVGGENSLPFLDFEGIFPHRPVIAWELLDKAPTDWVDPLGSAYSHCSADPLTWADYALSQGARLLCLTLQGTHPENPVRSLKETVELVKTLLKHIPVPLIIKGVGPAEHQGEILSRIAEAIEGTNCVLASALEENYKTIVAAAMAFGHTLVAETPIDVNLAKQLNILITDMNFPPERILIDPLTGGLGYGLEYTYSVMERIRLQALNGDPMMQMPFICFVGDEAWRVKEVRVPLEEKPDWGEQSQRAILWEIATALPLLHAGAAVLVMRHPEAIRSLEQAIADLYTRPVAAGKE